MRRADPLGTADLETAPARLVLVPHERAQALISGGVGGETPLGYPRQDDLDALAMVREGVLDPWSVREIVRRGGR